MSKQQIPTVCIQCQKHFLSKKRNTKFCSDICKAQEKRDRDKILHQSQAKIIQVQSEIIKVVLPKTVEIKPVPNSRISGDYAKNNSPVIEKNRAQNNRYTNEELEQILSGILFPSVSKWKAGKFNSAEIKEFTRVATEMGLTLDEYMKHIEAGKEHRPEAIRKVFE